MQLPFLSKKQGPVPSASASAPAPADGLEDLGEMFEGLPISLHTKELLNDPQAREAFRRPYVPNSDAERRMVRKVDTRLMPMLWLMYVLNYIDRTNIGNAKVGGMQKDLSLSATDYSLALLIFFVGYLLFEIPSNMLLTRSRPSLFLPTIMLVWGSMTIAFKAINTLGELVALRFVLGIIESGFFPGVLFLLSSWYKPAETAKRFAIFYSASILSGAFGGILANLIISHMSGRNGIAGWKWLFIVEGICTVGVSLIAYFVLPDYPQNTKWLTVEERTLATKRLLVDAAASGKFEKRLNHKEAFMMAVKDWKTWVLTVGYMCIAGAGTISYFIPTIVTQLGYAGTQAQLYSAIPYACAFVVSLCGNYSSDHFREKAFHASAAISAAGIFCIVQAVGVSPRASFAVLCLVACGIWTALPTYLAFVTLVMRSPPEKRAVAIAIINSLGNFSSVYGSFLWPRAPYTMGWSVTAAFCFLAAVITLFVRWREGAVRGVDDVDAARQVEEQLHERQFISHAHLEKEGSASAENNSGEGDGLSKYDSTVKDDGLVLRTESRA